MWACPSYSGCDSEIAFPLDAGCKRQGIKLKFELKGLNLAAVFQVHTQHGTCRSARTAWLSYGWLDKVYECVSIM